MDIERHSGETEVAIVGAGAAGIGAACALAAAKKPFVVLEAGPRVGGRAWTVQAAGFPVDMGCGWLHSADKNPMTAIAEQLGFQVDRARPHWERQSCNQGFSAEDQKSFRRSWAKFNTRVEETPLAHDVAAATLLEPGPWTPLMQSISTYMNATSLDDLSVYDLRNYDDTEINWRVVEGYGHVFATLAQPHPIALTCPVTSLDHSGRKLVIETAKGTLRASKAIITVSTNVLAAEAIRFTPGVPDKLAQAADLPLGVVNKGFFHCDDSFPTDGHLFGNIHTADTGSYHLRPFGRPLIEGFFAGHVTGAFGRDGARGLLDFGLSELVAALGSDMRKRLQPLQASAWGVDPFMRGSYSYAKIGRANARAALAQPLEDRIFFAGEATSPHAFSTAHGAYLSGITAARNVIV